MPLNWRCNCPEVLPYSLSIISFYTDIINRHVPIVKYLGAKMLKLAGVRVSAQRSLPLVEIAFEIVLDGAPRLDSLVYEASGLTRLLACGILSYRKIYDTIR